MKVVFQVPQDGQYGLDIYTRERFHIHSAPNYDFFFWPSDTFLFV